MPIQPLERIVVKNTKDGFQTTKLPSNEDMMNKINEIVRLVNHLEQNDFKRSFKDEEPFKPRLCR
ncbi:hypothetical protein ABFV99_13420 [Cytobacillus horneckiae]|uniref:hypothetical protein n=1 Tax=Cytobacillus horneckiae TaxID=549687 RepID=UPI0034CFE0C2